MIPFVPPIPSLHTANISSYSSSLNPCASSPPPFAVDYTSPFSPHGTLSHLSCRVLSCPTLPSVSTTLNNLRMTLSSSSAWTSPYRPPAQTSLLADRPLRTYYKRWWAPVPRQRRPRLLATGLGRGWPSMRRTRRKIGKQKIVRCIC